MGLKKVKFEKECPICKCIFETYPRRPSRTCSKKCMGIYQRGENNPNYGNSWSEEQRKHLSDHQLSISHIISTRVKADWENNEERRKSASEIMSVCMQGNTGDKNPFYGKTHDLETRKIIGLKSKEKYSNVDYVKKFRETMENLGYWRPLNRLSLYEIYFKESDWVARMFDIIPNGLNMLNEFGVFHASLNNNGVVRDHIVGRRYGFKHQVFPVIMRHPANCQILRQIENVSKSRKKSLNSDCQMTLDELFEKIEKYDGDWIEQEIVMESIYNYRCGQRWSPEKKGGCL